jgi:hypothetical protein
MSSLPYYRSIPPTSANMKILLATTVVVGASSAPSKAGNRLTIETATFN